MLEVSGDDGGCGCGDNKRLVPFLTHRKPLLYYSFPKIAAEAGMLVHYIHKMSTPIATRPPTASGDNLVRCKFSEKIL